MALLTTATHPGYSFRDMLREDMHECEGLWKTRLHTHPSSCTSVLLHNDHHLLSGMRGRCLMHRSRDWNRNRNQNQSQAFGRKKITKAVGISCKGQRTSIGFCQASDKAGERQTLGIIDVADLDSVSVQHVPAVKICGVAHPEDAAWAARCGADFVGMILWPKSKRSVSRQQAADVANAAKENGAVPVGVFVDEGAEAIVDWCSSTGISIAQLHGDGARNSLRDLPDWLQVVYVLNADKEGTIQTAIPWRRHETVDLDEMYNPRVQSPVDWLLIDGLSAGSGESFDWKKLEVPRDCSKRGWWLAGGLHPANVANACRILLPDLVDVSSGVCGIDGVRKDLVRVKSFIDNVKSVQSGAG